MTRSDVRLQYTTATTDLRSHRMKPKPGRNSRKQRSAISRQRGSFATSRCLPKQQALAAAYLWDLLSHHSLSSNS